MRNKKIKNYGFVLIIMVGVLCVVTLLAIAFAAMSRLEEQAAKNYNYKIRAKYLAEAGINKAISELKEQAKSGFIWTTSDGWYSGYDSATEGETLLDGCGKYTVTIIDCSSQIDINDTNNDNLDEMLARLPSITETEADDIITYRDSLPNGVFETKEQIRQVPGLIDAGESYDDFKDYITVHSYIDDFYDYDVSDNTYSQTSRAPINVNIASSSSDKTVLLAVLTGISDGTNTISEAEAELIASDIIDDRPFSTWSDFEDCLDGSVSDGDISSDEKDLIMNNANPNREKPSTFTTEFCFQAGGYFELKSTGTLYRTSSQTETLGEDVITAVIRTHKVISFSDKPDFNEDLNYNGSLDAGEYDIDADGSLDFPTFHNVNWQDTCPVTSDYDEGLSLQTDYETIAGSLKLGFWDNFDEDNDTTDEEGWSYYNWLFSGSNTSMTISDVDTDGDMELWGESSVANPEDYYFSMFKLRRSDNSNIWACDDKFSYRVYAKDPVNWDIDPSDQWSRPDGWDDASTVECQTPADGTVVKLWVGAWGFLYSSSRTDITVEGSTVATDPDTIPREGKDWFDTQLRLHFWKPSWQAQERFLHIADTFYGISDCTTDHYNNWADDEDNDQYHGVMPTELTYKFVVSDALGSPDYRVYLAAGDAWHIYYDYSNGLYKGRQSYSTTTTDYVNIPLHSSTEDYYDRYGYWTAFHNPPNSWRDEANGWYLALYSKKVETKWDDIRIIPNQGDYESGWFNPSEGEVRWAALSWTETTPSTADSSSETVSVSIDTGSGFGAASLGGSIDELSSQIRFKVDLASSDDDYSETPVFEDITFIYLIPTEVFYWKEK